MTRHKSGKGGGGLKHDGLRMLFAQLQHFKSEDRKLTPQSNPRKMADDCSAKDCLAACCGCVGVARSCCECLYACLLAMSMKSSPERQQAKTGDGKSLLRS